VCHLGALGVSAARERAACLPMRRRMIELDDVPGNPRQRFQKRSGLRRWGSPKALTASRKAQRVTFPAGRLRSGGAVTSRRSTILVVAIRDGAAAARSSWKLRWALTSAPLEQH